MQEAGGENDDAEEVKEEKEEEEEEDKRVKCSRMTVTDESWS